MKNYGKRTLSLMLTAVMLLSLIVVPGLSAQATENEDPHVLFNYGCGSFVGPEGYYEVVEDPDALSGEATRYTNRDMSAASIPLYRYGKDENPQHLLLGAVAKADLKANDGKYHTYSFPITLPENLVQETGCYVYFTSSSVIQNHHMATNLKALAGQTVIITISMKIESENENLSNSTVYIDNMQIRKDDCKDYQVGGYCSKCGKDLSDRVDTSAHVLHDYSYTNFAGGGGVTAVEDTEAYNGWAKRYGTFNFSSSNTIPLYRYGKDESEFKYQHLKLGEVAKADLKLNDGYHTYSFTTYLPEEGLLTNGNYVYFTSGSTIQNAAMALDLKALAGKTVTITMSMKITGELSAATIYVDRMQILDSCQEYPSANGTYCSKCGKSLLDETLPKELQLLDTQHITRFDAKTLQINIKSGEAIVDDTDSPLGKAWTRTMNVSSGLDLRWFASGVTDRSLINITYDSLKTNLDAGYMFYKTKMTVWEDIPSTGSYTYLDWYCCSPALCNGVAALKGREIDVYLSAKVTGEDATSTSVYIDQVILVDHCKNHRVGDSCSVCGKDLSQNVNPEAHILHNYEYNEITTSNFGTEVQDSDGKWAKAFSENLSKGLSVLGDGTGTLTYGKLPASSIQKDGEYHSYAITLNLPATGLENNKFVYFTDSWVFRNTPMGTDLRALAGKTVTFVISMKVECETPDDLSKTTVYVDRMQLVDFCEDNLSENGTYCTACGKTYVDESLPEELRQLDARHIQQYGISDFSCDAGGYYTVDAESPVNVAWTLPMNVTGGIDFYRYAASPEQYLELVKIPYGNIKADDGYHIYKNTVEVPEDIANPGSYTYVNWYCRNTALCADLVDYAGKMVDMYLSMKVISTDKVDGNGKPISDVYIDRMILVDRCENHWDEGIVIQAPTEEADGIKAHTCALCGAAGKEILPKLAPAKTWNLVLNGNIGMNFVLNVTAKEAATATVEVTVNGETKTYDVADLLVNGEYVLKLDLAAAQMADVVTVKLYKGDTTVSKDYSVRAYADYILADTEGVYTETAKALVKAMLAYGSASQTYFQYNDGTLADAGIEVTPAAVPEDGVQFNVAGSAEGVKYYGASLVYRNKIAARIYFSGDVTGKIVTVNGVEVTPGTKDDLYYIEVADICPQDLDESITVTVDGLTVTYAPMDYIIRMYAKGGNSKALVQALYGYYLAAEAYIN